MERQNLKLKKTLEVLKKLREENISIDDLIEAIEVVNQLSGEVSITEEQNVSAAMIEMKKRKSQKHRDGSHGAVAQIWNSIQHKRVQFHQNGNLDGTAKSGVYGISYQGDVSIYC